MKKDNDQFWVVDVSNVVEIKPLADSAERIARDSTSFQSRSLTGPVVSRIERITMVIQLRLRVNSTVREIGESHSGLPFRSVPQRTPVGSRHKFRFTTYL